MKSRRLPNRSTRASTNVTVGYASENKAVHIITADGQSLVENRPMTSLVVSIQLTDKDGKIETGTAQTGGIPTPPACSMKNHGKTPPKRRCTRPKNY